MTRARDVANVLSTATALATDTETAAAISTHASDSDPHGDRAYAAALIPSQSGNTGKYLTTDGSIVSWSIVSAGVSLAKVYFMKG